MTNSNILYSFDELSLSAKRYANTNYPFYGESIDDNYPLFNQYGEFAGQDEYTGKVKYYSIYSL